MATFAFYAFVHVVFNLLKTFFVNFLRSGTTLQNFAPAINLDRTEVSSNKLFQTFVVKLESFPSELIQCYLIKMPDLRGNIDVLKSSNSQEYF